MPDAGHIPVTIDEWKGMYTRGVSDSSPKGYFLDSLNVKFHEQDVYTRDGSTLLLTIPNIVRFSVYKRLGETVRHIYLNTGGQLYDSLFPNTPIWTDATFVDFSGLNFNNRFYITPHNRTSGITGKSVLVYDGSGTARLACGAAPVGFTLGAANSGVSGNVEAGTHVFAVAFESSSGFITAPGPTLFATVTAAGHFSVDLSALPALPAGMVAVRVVATKAIQTYNGNQLGYRFYLVSTANGGRITGGAATGRVSFFDAELTADATYLFNNRATIPAGVCICNYNGRMCIAGNPADPHSVYISKPYDPEQMNVLTGFITVDPFESGAGITNLASFRGNFVVAKSHRIYQTTDNQADPVTWNTALPVDQGAGTECFGIGSILDSKGQQTDRLFMADRSGLLLYEGYVKRPECSWLVEDTWDRINKAVFNLIQICIDPETKSIYVTVPLDGSLTISHILYGYYGAAYGPYGFDSKEIKWTLWTTAPGVSCIAVDVDAVTGASVLKYGGSTGNLYKITDDYSVHNDNGVAYQSFVKSARYTTKPKWTQHINLIGLRVVGNGILLTTVFGQDDTRSLALANKTMAAASGTDLEIKANFESSLISVRFLTGNNIDEYFKLIRTDLYLKPRWISQPG